MPTRRSVSETGARFDPLLILHALIEDAGCLEGGLRLLAMDRPSRDHCAAWGFDRDDRSVVVYVASGEVRSGDLEQWLESGSGARERTAGRLLVLAPRFGADLALKDWTVEPWQWGREESDRADVWIEPFEPEADTRIEHARVRLIPEEIESLVGSWPAAETGV